MHFQPLPTTGSSGGPIVDENTGAVVGVVLGTQMDSSIKGVRGWGVPAETIFEVRERSLAINATLIRNEFRCLAFQGSSSSGEGAVAGVLVY
jgi:hypothetical protein